MTTPLHHRLRRMTGRDPEQRHRAATPLELLFDLTFVAAIGLAADQMAHLLAEGHLAPALIGFAFSMFAISWAWVNYSWFASAFDTDDWLFRVLTMVQMAGVIVLALGLPAMFHSLDAGETPDVRIMVGGYVVMRIALVAQWLRAARSDSRHRRSAIAYAATVTVSQVCWVGLLFLREAPAPLFLAAFVVALAIDILSPFVSERVGVGTPWHAHHIAERYSLFVIIALGESILGTIAAVSAIVEHQGWSAEAILVIAADTGLTFAMWWIYFMIPSARVLHAHRERATFWSYGHLPLLASVAAAGAGMHVAAYLVEGESELGPLGTVLATAIPVLIFVVAVFVIYSVLLRQLDLFHLGLFGATAALLVLGAVLAGTGAGLGVSLLVVMTAPFVIVVGFEVLGHRHQAEALESALAAPGTPAGPGAPATPAAPLSADRAGER